MPKISEFLLFLGNKMLDKCVNYLIKNEKLDLVVFTTVRSF